jgi:hypothetical protein
VDHQPGTDHAGSHPSGPRRATHVIELHGAAVAPVAGSFTATVDGDYGIVELRLRGD